MVGYNVFSLRLAACQQSTKQNKQKKHLEPSSLKVPLLCSGKFAGVGAGENPQCLSTDMSDTDLKVVISSPLGCHLAG